MPEVTLKINNRGYNMACDEGQDQRLVDLSHFVDSRLQGIAQAGAASNETHLLVLTSLVLADEVYELRDQVAELQANGEGGAPIVVARDEQEEVMIARAIDGIAERIEQMATRLGQVEKSKVA